MTGLATNATSGAGGTVPAMIGYLQGRAASPNLVLTSGGVGYLVHTAAPLPAGEDVELYVTTIVREDAITLYGFTAVPAQELFGILTRISGVGPSVALALLRDLGAGPLVTALVTGDAKALTRAAGVGLKKAETIVTMAKGKVPAALAAAIGEEPADLPADPHSELVATLVAMGFGEPAAADAVATVAGLLPDAEDGVLLRRALTALNTAA